MEEDIVYVETRYATFWERLVAFIIDYLLVSFIMAFFITIASMLGYSIIGPEMFESGDDFVRDLSESSGELQWIILLCTWLYFALLHSSKWQATIGKQAMRIQVTDKDGERINFFKATIRFFSKAFISTSLTLLIGYIIAAFTPRRQTLHDLIAGTIVLKNV